VMAAAGLLFRGDGGVDAVPLLHALLGVASVGLAVLLVRLLEPLLRRERGYYDAD